MRDAEKLVAWVREAADELEKAHAFLDAHDVPRSVPGHEPTECTLAARIAVALDKEPPITTGPHTLT